MTRTATQQRDFIFEMLETARADWLIEARIAAKRLYLESNAPITIDDVRKICPPPKSIDPRVMGVVFKPSQWEPIGYAQSERRQCHGRVIRAFRLRERI